MKIIIPGQNVPITDGGDPINPVWYEKLKFLEKLQPLSDIVFPSDASKSNVVRTVNTQTGVSAYTLQLTDSGNVIDFNNGTAVSVTVPPNSSVAFPAGTQIDIMQAGAGKVTLVQGAGVTIQSAGGNKAIAAQYVGVTLLKLATDVWRLMGSLIP